MKRLLILLVLALPAYGQIINPGIPCSGGNCTVSGNLTVTGAAYLSSAIVTPGRPGDNTIGSQAGFMVQWDSTNSRWTACATNSTTLCVPTTYTAANSANGTGNRPDGKPACGGGGTVGGAAVCTYTTLTTVVATFDGAVTNGNLVCAKSGSTATYLHDCGTAALASVAASQQVVGVITSAGSGSPVTASADVWTGYQTPPTSTSASVAVADATAQTADIGATLLYAVPANKAGTYAVYCSLVSTNTPTNATLPACQIGWTDADSSVAEGQKSIMNSTTGVSASGTFGRAGSSATNPIGGWAIIQAKASTNINYSTSGYAAGSGTALQFAVHFKLFYLGQ